MPGADSKLGQPLAFIYLPAVSFQVLFLTDLNKNIRKHEINYLLINFII
jgi:hypothetical protein